MRVGLNNASRDPPLLKLLVHVIRLGTRRPCDEDGITRQRDVHLEAGSLNDRGQRIDNAHVCYVERHAGLGGEHVRPELNRDVGRLADRAQGVLERDEAKVERDRLLQNVGRAGRRPYPSVLPRIAGPVRREGGQVGRWPLLSSDASAQDPKGEGGSCHDVEGHGMLRGGRREGPRVDQVPGMTENVTVRPRCAYRVCVSSARASSTWCVLSDPKVTVRA